MRHLKGKHLVLSLSLLLLVFMIWSNFGGWRLDGLSQSQEAFSKAEESIGTGRISQGEVHLQRGLLVLYQTLQAIEDSEEREDIVEVFHMGEDLYLRLEAKGELREITEGLFYLLTERLVDLLLREESREREEREDEERIKNNP